MICAVHNCVLVLLGESTGSYSICNEFARCRRQFNPGPHPSLGHTAKFHSPTVDIGLPRHSCDCPRTQLHFSPLSDLRRQRSSGDSGRITSV
ncbi:hypothetical protein B0H21DRAFT_728225 [Amylocystis lapponica]|nr:hypothetical protein B0H21DRAFT_728225 [Amylocystis lapponica]